MNASLSLSLSLSHTHTHTHTYTTQIPARDADRVVVLHGPISARYSTKVNEPVSEILRNILKDLSKRFIVGGGGDSEKSQETTTKTSTSLTYSDNKISEETWFEQIAQEKTWIRDALQSQSVVGHDKRWIANPIRALFSPQLNDRVERKMNEITLYRDHIERVRLSLKTKNSILATLYFKDKNTCMNLNFQSSPRSYMPLRFCHEDEEKRSIKSFYAKIWNVQDLLLPFSNIKNKCRFVVQREHVETFCETISCNKAANVPMDYLIVAAWRPIASCLLQPKMPSMLTLVHLSNEYEWTCKKWNLREPVIYGDELETSARVVEIRTNSTGRTVVVRADVYRKKHAIVTILSSFLFRGNSLSTELDFSINTLGRSREDISEIEMNETEIEILHKKSWFTSKNIPSSSFSTVSFAELNIERGFQKCKVSGDVYALSGKEERINIGTVHYSSSESDRNPVVEYLQRVS